MRRDEKTIQEIADALKWMRYKTGYTQREVAEAIGVTRRTIGRYESGERTPDIFTFKELVDFYGYRMEYIKND